MKIEIDRIDLTENKTDLPGKWFQRATIRARADMEPTCCLCRIDIINYPLAPPPMSGATIRMANKRTLLVLAGAVMQARAVGPTSSHPDICAYRSFSRYTRRQGDALSLLASSAFAIAFMPARASRICCFTALSQHCRRRAQYGAAARIDAKRGVVVDSQQTTALAKVSGSSAVVAKAGA